MTIREEDIAGVVTVPKVKGILRDNEAVTLYFDLRLTDAQVDWLYRYVRAAHETWREELANN